MTNQSKLVLFLPCRNTRVVLTVDLVWLVFTKMNSATDILCHLLLLSYIMDISLGNTTMDLVCSVQGLGLIEFYVVIAL